MSSSSNHPLVSIIIPTYNCRRWLGDTIDSALAQTYPNCEVLVVDDGSTDGTGDWLAKQYGERIRYFWKENGGLSSARNFGLHHARGEYIQFLDADDLLLPNKTDTHVTYLEAHPEVDVVYCHCLTFSDDPEEAEEWPRKHLYQSGQAFSSMINGGYILCHMPLTRRKAIAAIEPFDEERLQSCADWDFWLRLAWSGANFHYLDGPPMVRYRVYPDSMSHAHVNHAREALTVLRKVRSYVSDPTERRRLRIRQAESRWRFSLGVASAESGQRWQGWLQIALALVLHRYQAGAKLVYLLLMPWMGPQRTRGVMAMGGDVRRRLRTVLSVGKRTLNGQ